MVVDLDRRVERVGFANSCSMPPVGREKTLFCFAASEQATGYAGTDSFADAFPAATQLNGPSCATNSKAPSKACSNLNLGHHYEVHRHKAVEYRAPP